MKKINLLFVLTLLSCSHPVHKPYLKSGGPEAFEYCGGDMWGYAGPVAADEKKEAFETAFSGVAYLDSHKKTLLFTYAMEIFGSVDVEFERNEIQLNVNGKLVTQKPMEVAVHRIPFGPSEKFPPDKYSLRLLNYEKNQWEVTKLNPVFKHLIKGESKIVALAKTQVTVVKDGKFHFPHEKEVKKTMLISIIPLWSVNEPLTDAEIGATIPAFSFRGRKQKAQEFNFSFQLKNWEEREKKGKPRCPSLEELFRWKR